MLRVPFCGRVRSSTPPLSANHGHSDVVAAVVDAVRAHDGVGTIAIVLLDVDPDGRA